MEILPIVLIALSFSVGIQFAAISFIHYANLICNYSHHILQLHRDVTIYRRCRNENRNTSN